MLLALLRERFGTLPQEMENAVNELADADKLMRLTLVVYQSDSLETFFGRLHSAANQTW